ncbi:MAG: STAS domain-containing protein [Kiritimatiellae bacterium]|nr:STAS domain-containing protein [Kiritimatiellia bacterium]MDD5519285.1 STAS domain-containing protein [Kiritimatiellia bacterium]
MPLKISLHERRPTVYEVALNGSIDGETNRQLDKFVDDIFKFPVRGLTFNMHGVDYVSSAGIRSVLLAMRKTKAGGGVFAMIDMQTPVKTVFEIAQILPQAKLFASVEEADKYFDIIQKQEREKDQQKPA